MTDDESPELAWLREQLPDETPADVVPRPLLDRETVLSIRAMAGREVTVTFPGEPIYGPDGALLGMTAPTTTTATLGRLYISETEAERLGLPE